MRGAPWSRRRSVLGALQPVLQEWVDDLEPAVDACYVAVVDQGLAGLLGDALVQRKREQRRGGSGSS